MNVAEHEFIPYHAEHCLAHGRVLVLAPHPDDEVFGCGGAIMRHLAAGDPVRVIVVTDGALGVSPDQPDPVRTRRDETRRAAAVLGHVEPIFWDWPDRGLTYGETLIGQILEAVADWSADLVYAPSWWEIHPDHLTLALASAEAVRRCERPLQLALYEVGSPLWPNRLLDITDLAGRKHAAMVCFTTQMTQQDYDRHVAGLNSFRTYTLPREIRAAEAYRLLSRDELRAPPWDRMRPDAGYTLKSLANSLRQPCGTRGAGLCAVARATAWRLATPLRWLEQRRRHGKMSR